EDARPPAPSRTRGSVADADHVHGAFDARAPDLPADRLAAADDRGARGDLADDRGAGEAAARGVQPVTALQGLGAAGQPELERRGLVGDGGDAVPSGRALRAGIALLALRPLRALGTLRPLRAAVTLLALGALRPLRTPWALRTGVALLTLGTLRAGVTLVALRPLRPLRPRRTARTARARVALLPLGADARRPLGTGLVPVGLVLGRLAGRGLLDDAHVARLLGHARVDDVAGAGGRRRRGHASHRDQGCGERAHRDDLDCAPASRRPDDHEISLPRREAREERHGLVANVKDVFRFVRDYSCYVTDVHLGALSSSRSALPGALPGRAHHRWAVLTSLIRRWAS